MEPAEQRDRLEHIRSGKLKVAFGSRLKGVRGVITLGVRPNLEDYSPAEWSCIRNAPVLYYPTALLSQPLLALGKRLFPGYASCYYAGDKIRQTTLFKLMGIPHPRTRLYFRRHFEDILRDFDFPFVAKAPRGSDSGRGVFLVDSRDELKRYLENTPVAYIQEYLNNAIDYRVVLIGYKPVLAYRRTPAAGEFRANVARGGAIDFNDIPEAVIEIADKTARSCQFDDVGVDVVSSGLRYYVLEANFRYGRKGFKAAGLSYKGILEEMLARGEI
ncbi:MAG: RimK family alpha-L-glutamate ligase [Deltaproteobacteria bacterium]|nr:RimK family alpha-L-glutamate ligase [Deltaproteobacteria bacterium]